jgi:beta-phosphoglucomutase family hydrolase
MSRSRLEPPLVRSRYDAVLFDLDGVLTDTAKLHAACWKRLFDDYLRGRSDETGEPFVPFDVETDYRLYVDGKVREDGVRDFLASRGIDLPEGSPDEPPGRETVQSMGNRKDGYVNEVLATDGVDAYESSVAVVRALRAEGFKTAVVSSSRNCQAVLATAGIEDLFDARVDGEVAGRLGLAGKPDPETFLTAAKQLGVEPARAVVIEDAISGVQAGRDGGFGLVIGVARHAEPGELTKHGAEIVVHDLGELLG